MKKIIKQSILTAIVGLSFTTVAVAANETVPNLNTGTKSLRVNGSYDANHALDYEFTLEAGFGYFFWDNIELSILGGVQSNKLIDTYELGAVGEYNLNFGSAWVPYFQVGVLWAAAEVDDDVYNDSGDLDETAWIGRFGGGIKYFFRDDIAVSLGINYDIASEDLYMDDKGNVDDYNWTALLGLRFYFD